MPESAPSAEAPDSVDHSRNGGLNLQLAVGWDPGSRASRELDDDAGALRAAPISTYPIVQLARPRWIAILSRWGGSRVVG